jgi:hypothetical protein
MAHFAKLDENNIVIDINVVNNNVLDSQNEEQSGIDFLTQWSNGYTNWKQTSYNANFRKNYAGIGHIYDPIRNAFISPKPFNSWMLNETTCKWEAPISYPDDNKVYFWNEENQSWDEVE